MLKFAIVAVVNRLLILAVIFMLVSAYARDNCRDGESYIGTIEHALDGWRELQRAFQ